MLESEDEELRRALKLSMQEISDASTQDITDDSTQDLDEEPEAVNLTSRLPKNEMIDLASDEDESPPTKRRKLDAKQPSADASQAAIQRTTGGIKGLDRAQMERERLARLGQQRVSPPPLKRASQTRSPVSKEENVSKNSSDEPSKSTLQYPEGALKKTWAYGFPRNGNDIKIEEVLQKRKLNIAVLSSYQWDPQWIFSKIDLNRTKLILVMQAKADEEKQAAISEAAKLPNCLVCFPSMVGQINCMHSKLQLLFYDDCLRVVVPSANLTSFDWGETGILENSVFLIDLPRLPQSTKPQDEKLLTFFGQELLRFLRAKGLSKTVIEGVTKFDFAATEGMAFVHTIGGANEGESWKFTGFCGLGQSVRRLGLQTPKSIDVDFVISSIGALGIPFIKSIYDAARGEDPLIAYTAQYDKTKKKSKTGSAEQDAEALTRRTLEQHFRAYFPSNKTVRESVGGTNNGGTLFLTSASWYKDGFPQTIFRDCQSKRQGMLMHNKMMFVRSSYPLGTNSSGTSRKAWLYHGSANFSESAWGRLVKDTSSKKPKLNCRNWECGVLLPVPEEMTQDLIEDEQSMPPMEVFDRIISAPMLVPGEPLKQSGRRPWFLTSPDLW